jgi:hypothetical protein
VEIGSGFVGFGHGLIRHDRPPIHLALHNTI